MGGTEAFVQIWRMGLVASGVILAVLLVRGMLRHIFPKKYLYWMWLIVGIRLLCPVAIASPVSLFQLQEMAGIHFLTPDNFLQGEKQEEAEGKYAREKTGGRIADSKNTEDDIKIHGDLHTKVAVQKGEGSAEEKLSDELPARQDSMPVPPISPLMLRILTCIWLAGIAAALLWNLILAVRIKGQVRKAVRFRGNIYECDSISTPFVMGLLRPRIYIPFRLGEEERTYILRHEQYHIRRRDYLVKPAAFLITLVYWFHPLVWIAYLCMVRDMEMSCDEYVLSSLDRDMRADYSKSLLGFAMNRRNIAMNLIAFGESDTRRRVQNIMKYKKRGKWIGTAAVLILLAVGAVCLTDANARKEERKVPKQVQSRNSGKEEASPRVQEEPIQGDQVKLGIYTPDSTGLEAKFYTPAGKEQRAMQKLAGKLDASRGSSARERKQWYKERKMGYEIYYAGGYWDVYSGGYLCYLGKGEEYDYDEEAEEEETEDTLIYLPELCELSEKYIRNELSYDMDVVPKEIQGFSEAVIDYRTRKGIKSRQSIRDSKKLRVLEGMFSQASYIGSASACPFGNGILTLYWKDGRKIALTLATDNCEVYRLNGVYYDYKGKKDFENWMKLEKIFNKIPLGQ